jgi:hypothetical protein
VDVIVTTPGGTSTTSSADKFTYTSAPATTRTEQTSASFAWTGTWTLGSTNLASGGSLRYTNSASSVTISFTGTYLAWISAKAPAYGIAKVTVDGLRTYTVNLYSATTLWKQMVFNTGILPSGPHTVKIEWTGIKGVPTGGGHIGIDAVDIAGSVTPLNRYQDSDPGVMYTGAWQTGTTSLASGGSVRLTDSPGSVSVTFTGTYLSWTSAKASTYGIAKVSLDGVEVATVDLYSAATTWQQSVWNTGTLPSGTHTVTIAWTGTKSALAASSYVSIDALDVVGTLVRPTRYQDSDPGLTYTGTWQTGTTSLASGGSVRLTDSPGSVSVTFTGTYLAWISAKASTYGIAHVAVGGNDAGMVDLYSSSTVWRQNIWSTMLPEGTYTVTITWTGQKNPAASFSYIGLDAFDVMGSVVQTPSG